MSLTPKPLALPACPAQGPRALEGRPPSALRRPALSALFIVLRGAGAGGQSSLRGQPPFFQSFGGFLAGPASTYAHWSPGRRGLSLSSGAACRAVGERGVQGGHGGGGRRSALLPRVLWGAYRWATQDAEAEPPLWEGPRYGLLSRAEGTSEPGWFQWGHGAQRGVTAQGLQPACCRARSAA